MPCRSGLPSAVCGGVHVFPAVCPAAGTCASRAITTMTASAAKQVSERRPMGASFRLITRLLPKTAVHQLFGELHALVLEQPRVLFDATIERHADLPGTREPLRIFNRRFIGERVGAARRVALDD